MPNRVAELESAVAQLQATVNGLREELVDSNERIRSLERELESQGTTQTSLPQENQPTSPDGDDADGVPPDPIEDIIVA